MSLLSDDTYSSCKNYSGGCRDIIEATNAVAEMLPRFLLPKFNMGALTMDGQVIASIIGASSGLIIGILGSLISYRKFIRKYKNASMKDNYQTLYAELRKDIGRLRDEQAEERRQWAEERKAFNQKIDKLQELVRTQDKALHSKDIQVTQLTGKVELLKAQLDTYREVHAPTKNVTIN